MTDPMEQALASIERWADSHMKGDNFLCDGCDEWYPIDEGVPASPHPCSPFICGKCAGL